MKSVIKVLIALATGAFLFLPSARGQASYLRPYTFITIAGTAGGAGGGDGTNAAAQFYWPEGVAVGANGNLYVVDNFENTVRMIAPVGTNWVVTTIAGVAGVNGGADGTNAVARFYQPSGIAPDGAGNLYVADSGNNTIRELTPMGTNWIVTTIAGTVLVNGSADGTNQAASFASPSGIAVDASGHVFVADTGNQIIRELTPMGTNWIVTTIAGTPGASGSTDGANQSAQFNGPTGLAVDGAGNLYVADANNDTIRELTPAGTNWGVTTIAGQAQVGGSADGNGPNAQFYSPSSVAADTNGNLYVTDTYNQTIRGLVFTGTNWQVTTLAGSPGLSGSEDGIVQYARFNYPFGIAVDPAGRLFVGDTVNDTIRLGWSTPVPDVAVSALPSGGAVVSWPGTDFFTLQTNANLAAGDWVDYGGPAVSANGSNTVTFPPIRSPLFFRLRD